MSDPVISDRPLGHQRDLRGDIVRMRLLLRRGWRLITVAVVLCLTLSIIYLARAQREYEATTRLLVMQQGGVSLTSSTDATQRERDDDYIATHSLIIQSPMVVKAAIDIVGIDNLPSLLALKKGGRNPVDVAVLRLKITRPDRLAKIIRVDYRAPSPAEAVRMVEALVESYKKFLERTYQQNSGEVVALITKARDELSQETKVLEAEYLEFRKGAKVLTDENGRAFITHRLQIWDDAANQALLKQVQLKAQLELGKKLAADGAEFWAVTHAISQLGGDTMTLSMALNQGASGNASAGYIGLLTQQQHELIEKHGPQLGRVQELEEQINRAHSLSREARGRMGTSQVRELLASIDQSLKAVDTMRKEIGQRFDTDVEAAKKVETDILAEKNLKAQLERQQTLFNTVVAQLQQAHFVSEHSTITSQTIEPPSALDSPVRPKVTFTLIGALITGLVLGLGAALVADRLDQRIRSFAELRSILNLAVLGTLPHVGEDESRSLGEFGIICSSKPRSLWAESYRSARTSLDFIRRNQRVQVIMIASPYSGDGKSVTASNLAISFAQAGRSVLLIDGDLRKPSQHRIHGLSRDRGFAHILRDLLPFERVVQPTAIENLSLLATGPEVTNPAELLSSPRLLEFIEEARKTYDCIIMDSSPLLAVSDPLILAAAVDGVVLVVRATSLRQHDAHRTVEILRTLGMPVFGCFVNGITSSDGGYGYGYGYGYGQGYGYGYGQSYGYGGNAYGVYGDKGLPDSVGPEPEEQRSELNGDQSRAQTS